MKQYKRKRHIEANSLDIKPGKIGIKLEGSERGRAKKIIRKELADYRDEQKNFDNKKLTKGK